MGYVTEEFAFDPFFEGSFSEATVLGGFYSLACVEAYWQLILRILQKENPSYRIRIIYKTNYITLWLRYAEMRIL